MFNTKLKKRIKFLEDLTEVRGRRIDALSDNQRDLIKRLDDIEIENTPEKKGLNYYEENAEEDYIKTPISVLRYISALEKVVKSMKNMHS
jgi:hypothetical protein